MATTKTTRTPKETQAITRLRGLEKGVHIYCPDQARTCRGPTAWGDCRPYQVQVSIETMLRSCPTGSNDDWCKHVATVTICREARDRLEKGH